MPEKIIICEFEYKCLACKYYGICKLKERQEFVRQKLQQMRGTIWYNCQHKNWEKYCATCENVKQCRIERGLPYRNFTNKNVIINVFPDGDNIELLYYKKTFRHLEDSANLEEVDRTRLLKLNEKGIYEPVKDDFTIQAIQRSIRNANKRSKDSFYGFAKSNDWEYFITLTFSPDIVNRYDDFAVKELWSEFQRWCVRQSPNVKMLIIPERHKDGAIHFHGLMSDITFNLEVATDKNGKPLYSKMNTLLFKISDWKNGLSTLAIIPPDDNYARVINYMEKYIAKDGNIGYCQKRYYRTRNLEFKNKSIYYINDDELDDFVKSLGLEKVKDSDKLTVFRKPT